MTTVLQVGNFRPDHSTENDLRDALERLNVVVTPIQEDDWATGKVSLPEDSHHYDLVLWTRTWPVNPEVAAQLQPFQEMNVPVVGYHLDRWWGIERPDSANRYDDQYWKHLDRFYTADPQTDHWRRMGVDAAWTPPACSERWFTDPEPVNKWPGIRVAFVGNWHPDSYHAEHRHRFYMLEKLAARYGRAFGVIPAKGQPAIRGHKQSELYASIPVLIGDSCLVGLDAYWSDRVPETLGRGGYLLHPETHWEGHFEPGVHFDTWRLGDWEGMYDAVDRALGDGDYRQKIAAQGAAHVREKHTYTIRLSKVLEDML